MKENYEDKLLDSLLTTGETFEFTDDPNNKREFEKWVGLSIYYLTKKYPNDSYIKKQIDFHMNSRNIHPDGDKNLKDWLIVILRKIYLDNSGLMF